MANYTGPDPNRMLPGEPWTSDLALASFEDAVAIAEGAAGAPRVRGSAKSANLIASAVITSDVSSVEIINIEPHTRIRVGTLAGINNNALTGFFIEVSENNGGNWRAVLQIIGGVTSGTGRYFEADISCTPRVVFATGGGAGEAGLGGQLTGAARAITGDFSGGINAVRFRVDSGDMTSGTLAVYGIEREFE